MQSIKWRFIVTQDMNLSSLELRIAAYLFHPNASPQWVISYGLLTSNSFGSCFCFSLQVIKKVQVTLYFMVSLESFLLQILTKLMTSEIVFKGRSIMATRSDFECLIPPNEILDDVRLVVMKLIY